MLQLFFTVAFSAAPLILYVPPLRSLNLFVETVTLVLRDAVTYFLSVYPRLRVAISCFVSPHIAAAGR
ncbi:DIS3-exonuclease-like protein [Perilla frutescens var. frutescens]|nr:DIS3-exonuclease-like protein [Perilla frutescens var. frutescens]